MKQEDYVTFEVAKLLKEKGYNEPCFEVFTPKSKDEYRLSRRYPAETNEDIWSVKDGCDFEEYLAPSLAQAAKWIRSKGLEVASLYCRENSRWFYLICAIKLISDLVELSEEKYSPCVYSSYEQALNEGILEALKLINND